jgi:tellurium resistance protein TerD
MHFDIRKKVSGAVDSKSIISCYGKCNNQNIQCPIYTSASKSIIMNSLLSDRTKHTTNHNENHFPTQLQIKRNRISNHFVSIVKGQKCAIVRPDGSIPTQIHICLGWDLPQSNSQFELDASAFMLGINEKVQADEWFIFYGQAISPDGSVKYYSNKEKPGKSDDAEISVSLYNVASTVQKITLCITIYEAALRGISFSKVSNLYARILDEQNNELFYQPISDLGIETSVVVGELYRYKNSWKYCAVSSGYKRDLAQFCGIYGVELE